MNCNGFRCVALISLAFIPLIGYSLPTVVASPQDASKKRVVRMELTIREGEPPLRISAREGESATVEHPELGKFAFRPSLPKEQPSMVIVAVLDASVTPNRRLADVKVPADGKQRVQSKTTPDFGLRIISVGEAK